MKSDVEAINSLLKQLLTTCGRSTTGIETLVQHSQRAAPSPAPAATSAGMFAPQKDPGFNWGSKFANADGMASQVQPASCSSLQGQLTWQQLMSTKSICAPPPRPFKYHGAVSGSTANPIDSTIPRSVHAYL